MRLSLGDPGNRLDVHRMQRKQRRHHKASPGISGRTLQHQEEQHRVNGVEEHVFVVMAGRIEAEHLDVEGVRHPGKRMPIGGIAMSDSPHGHAAAQPVFDVRIFGNVLGVINIDEGMAVDRRINRYRHNREQQAQYYGSHNRIFCKESLPATEPQPVFERRWKPRVPLRFATSIADITWVSRRRLRRLA